MFTGIVQGTATIIAIDSLDQFKRIELSLPESACNNLSIGGSIALNGTCLTVTKFTGNRVFFDAIASTLALTNLAQLEPGESLNFERAARMGDEIGGHIMSGHICDRIKITNIEKTDTNCRIEFERPKRWARYLLDKGFVGLNGCSLTMTDVTDTHFAVWLIPETLERTIFGTASIGDRVNLEIDPQTQAIVDRVDAYLKTKEQTPS